MVNPGLRKALLEKLKCSPQAISQRAQKIKEQYSMTTEDAVYVIAQQEGLILDRYLDREMIDRVRELMQHISATYKPVKSRKSSVKKEVSSKKKTRIIVIPKEFEIDDPILSEEKALQAREMASLYPLLYVLENSIREIIDKVMNSIHGKDWWESQAPRGLKETVANRMADERRNSWHQRRGARTIDYLDLDQLPALVRKVEKNLVPDIIPSMEWFNQFIGEVYKSRCVLCHMNPLDALNIQALKVRFSQWQKQIKGKLDSISSP